MRARLPIMPRNTEPTRPQTMHCHLLLPGLLPPDRNFRAALAGTHLPALSLLLGRGTLRVGAGQAAEDWILREFPLPGATIAPLRLLGEDPPIKATGPWLCADPVHLHFTSQGLLLADATSLDIHPDEAAALIAGLNAEFGDLGRFIAATPTRWYLEARVPTNARFHPLHDTVGRRADRFLPEGPDAGAWRRHFNDIQVFLHNQPVNRLREDTGRPGINSVWFWGAGTLPTSSTSPRWAHVVSEAPFLRGLARHVGIPCTGGHQGLTLPEAADGALLALCEQARGAAGQEDHPAWAEAVAHLERHWVAPALEALRSGRCRKLSLSAPGDRQTLEISLGRADLWKFWRRPRPLDSLELPSQDAVHLAD